MRRFRKFIAGAASFAMAVSCMVTAPMAANATETDAIEEIISEETENIEALPESTYNYGKLLQYSLYLYDANMCGDDVASKTLLDWRGNCHTYDKTTYTRKDGVTVNVNAVGGFHDAGDHVKFGITEAYAPFILGMSYYTNKDAYVSAKQEGHLKTITDKFADYLKNCMVLDASGNVEAYLVQVGMGGAGYDHGYWGAPEDQPNGNRPFYFATDDNDPSTDIVSLSAAALAMNYINFGNQSDLDAAKKLFAFAKNNKKGANKSAGEFYASSGWTDDYCLAALLLNKATGDSSYYSAYSEFRYDTKAANVYWPLCWDNTAPAVSYFANDGQLKNSTGVSGQLVDGVYVGMSDWGSIRYNCGLQYEWLLCNEYSKAETQMKYILGNNKDDRCYVTGFCDNSVKYPHHRAASGYTGSVQATRTQVNTLIGAIVGGPSQSGSFSDDASNYQYAEVGIDYNANLVAAAAALYQPKKNDSNQAIDTNMYYDKPEEEDYIAKLGGASLTLSDKIGVSFYMDLSTQTLADNGAYFEAVMPNGKYEKIFISDATKSVANGNTYYVFKTKVFAKEMTDEIKVKIVRSNGTESDEYKYSVKKYGETVLDKPGSYASVLPLVKAMLNYGAAAQEYFGYNASDLANSIMSEAETVIPSCGDLSQYAFVKPSAVNGVSYLGQSLSLENEVRYRVYFSADRMFSIYDYRVTIDGSEISKSNLTVGGTVSKQYIDISGISPSKYGSRINVYVNGQAAEGLSIYSYIDLAKSTNKDGLKKLLDALYWYSNEAKEY